VSIGRLHVCAVKTTGALHCWGENTDGQLGLGADTSSQLTFTPVNGDLDWVAVSASDVSTCALKTGNRLYCWGLNDYGQLGTGGVMASRVPVEIGAAIDWAQVQATSRTTCGVDLLGKAYCWGADFFGQLGDGTANNNVAGATKLPTQVGIASDWVEVRPGWSHTCGRKTNGTLWCWGADTNGQLGDGMPSSTNTLVPVQVGGDADWSQLSTNDNYTCGVRAGGHAWCWGLNLRGVLGNGTTTNSSTPVEVRATP
jgi:alpha-tubulin suppressor-like RCC1 family protein